MSDSKDGRKGLIVHEHSVAQSSKKRGGTRQLTTRT